MFFLLKYIKNFGKHHAMDNNWKIKLCANRLILKGIDLLGDENMTIFIYTYFSNGNEVCILCIWKRITPLYNFQLRSMGVGRAWV